MDHREHADVVAVGSSGDEGFAAIASGTGEPRSKTSHLDEEPLYIDVR
jgi:hypothetical protein